ncbi:MAG: deaminase [archaeon]
MRFNAMKYLSDAEEKKAIDYINQAVKIALSSTCLRGKCGSIIIKNDEIIGEGFNSPPAEKESQRQCHKNKDEFHKKVADKTCCVHAEQRAIMQALVKNPQKLKNSTLYFIRLDKNNQIAKAGKPYCTHCSKLALDVGIKEFVLWHEKGVCAYDTEEYNSLSFQYQEF